MKTFCKTLLLLAIGVFSLSNSNAQGKRIKGVVTDNISSPLPGVNVVIHSTTNGTSSDIDGNFILENITNDKVQIKLSYIGFNEKILDIDLSGITEKDLGIITLKPDEQTLEEVVVTAMGIKRKVKALGYAAQTIKTTEINEAKDVNLLNNISGKIAGVHIVQGPTGPGSTSKIVIRGETSFNSNDPLFIVDGNPIFNNSIINPTQEGSAGSQAIDYGNAAGELSPDDIASITVLKGAGATALYGAKGSNGVVVIETKSVKNTGKLNVEVNSNMFAETILTTPKYQNLYGQGVNGEFRYGDGRSGGLGLNDDEDQSWGPAFSKNIKLPQFDSPSKLADGTIVRGGDIYIRGVDSNNPAAITPTTWKAHPENIKNFFQTGHTFINNIAVSGAYDKGNFRLSYTNLDNESIIPNTNLKRNSFLLKSKYNLTKKLSIKASANYINSQSDNRPANGYGSENLMYVFTWFGRSVNINSLKDYWQKGYEGTQQYNYNYAWHDNPYFTVFQNRNEIDKDRLIGNLNLDYAVNDKLMLSARAGMDYYNEFRPQYRAFSTQRFKNGGYIETNANGMIKNVDILAKYQNLLSDEIELTATLGANYFEQSVKARTLAVKNLSVPGIYSFSNAASPITNFELNEREKQNALYALFQFNYKNFLYLDISGRNDWSSTLASATNNKGSEISFFYPAISASYILSSSVNLPEIFNFVKLRASWAQVGNGTRPNLTKNLYTKTGFYNSKPYSSLTSVAGNPEIKPERSTSFEIGTDIRLFNNRVGLDLAYYNTLAEDQIIALPVSSTSGFKSNITNGGTIRSHGVEAVLRLQPIRNNNFEWKTQFNFSKNEATVESLPKDFDSYTISYARVYNNSSRTVWVFAKKGQRVGNMYGTGFLKDNKGNDIYNVDSKGNVEPIKDKNLRLLGNYNPDFTLGWRNSLRYKNFDLGFLWDWRQGGTIISRQLAIASTSGNLNTTAYRPSAGIQPKGVVLTGYDTNGNPKTRPFAPGETMNAVRYYKAYYDRDNEDNHKYDATFFKLREVSLGYSLPKKILGNTIESIRISLIGRNLLLFTENPHFDPEVLAVQGQNFVPGVEDMALPSARSFGININIKF